MSNSSLGLAFGHGNPPPNMTISSQRGFGGTGGLITSQHMLGSQNISMINTITGNNKFYMTPLQEIRFANDQRYFDSEYHKNRSLGEYVGQRKNNMRHGYGEMWYENGDFYAGYWEENQPSGDGLLFFSNSPSESKFSNPPKLCYSGTFEKGFFHGIGKTFIATSAQEGQFIYIGNWKNGQREGFGKQFYNDSDRNYYIGQWSNDMKNGEGRLVFENNEYEGRWLNDKMHGEGTLVMRDGNKKTVTIGIWDQDQVTSGQISYYEIKADGTGYGMRNNQQQFEVGLYKGEIKNYLRSGEGCYQLLNLGLTGQFEKDKLVGVSKLKGTVDNNQFELQTNFSQGNASNADARIFYWNKDQFDGKVKIDDWVIKRSQGKYYYSNGHTIQGTFFDNPKGELKGEIRQIN